MIIAHDLQLGPLVAPAAVRSRTVVPLLLIFCLLLLPLFMGGFFVLFFVCFCRVLSFFCFVLLGAWCPF